MKTKLFLLSLLTPLLFVGMSFCSASFFDNTQFTTVYHSVCDKNTQNTSDCFFDTYYYNSSSDYNYLSFNQAGIYCFAVSSNLSYEILNASDYTDVEYLNYRFGQNSLNTYTTLFGEYIDGRYYMVCSSVNIFKDFTASLRIGLNKRSSTTSLPIFYDSGVYFDISVGYVPLTGFNSISSSDCSSVESQLSSCQSSLSGANSSLSSCQSDLASCTNSCDTLVSQCQSDKSTLQNSYSGCLESNSSLNQYNQSLSNQLNECLMTNGTGFDGSGNIVLYEYQLSWFDGFSDLYLPITNSIKLPYGYRGFLDDGVLAIKNLNSLETAYSMNDESFNNGVVENFGQVFLFLMSSGLFLVFLYVIRRYFIGLKSIK